MLLKWTNRWRSRSNTFMDIYISLSLEFIGDVKLLFRFWYPDWFWSYGRKTEFSVFWGFSTLLPPQTKIQNSVSIESECSRFRGFSKIWLKSVLFIRRNLAEKIYKPFENISRRPTARLINPHISLPSTTYVTIWLCFEVWIGDWNEFSSGASFEKGWGTILPRKKKKKIKRKKRKKKKNEKKRRKQKEANYE